jgi:predicted neuraminidase
MALLFTPGSSFPQCHANTVAELPGGRLQVAFFAGTRERDPDTAIWMVSGDGEFSYPALIVTADGRPAATWTDHRTSIDGWQGSIEDCGDTWEVTA